MKGTLGHISQLVPGSLFSQGMLKVRLIVLGIFILALLAANVDYPKYVNRGITWVNRQNEMQETLIWAKSISIPLVPEFRLGLDLQGGAHLVYEADVSQIEAGNRLQALEGLRDVIERRVNYYGVTEPVVQINRSGESYRLIVELAGKEVFEAIQAVGNAPFLEFKEVEGEGEAAQFVESGLTGKYLQRSSVIFDPQTNLPAVSLEFNEEGAKLFEEITARNVGKVLAIFIDGIPISTPRVNEPISGGRAQISGDFTIENAKFLVRNLNAGALPVPITLISQQNVGATLGEESLAKSIRAAFFGVAFVALFMIFYYRLPGILAAFALFLYIILVLFLFKVFGVTLTLAGIAGFILSVGAAVDANVLIFERMREELRDGRSLRAAIDEGFLRAWTSIRDGNVTILITASILFWFGTSFVKGFALTLVLGLFVSMFSAITVTRTLLTLFVGSRFENVKPLWR